MPKGVNVITRKGQVPVSTSSSVDGPQQMRRYNGYESKTILITLNDITLSDEIVEYADFTSVEK